eukprot:7615267-Ditylum_brightwellii.AAC.1
MFLTLGPDSGHHEVSLAQQRGVVNPNWVLLDNQSTVDIFSNRALLDNLREIEATMDVHCNAGTASTSTVGTLHGYGDVWHDPNGIANILSMARVREKYPVTYSSELNEFYVHLSDGRVRVFRQSPRGLYYTVIGGEEGMAFVNTVASKKSNYSNADYTRAVLARKIQARIGRPSTKTFLDVIDNNKLRNCPVERRDIAAADDIFGPDLGNLKGKTTKRKNNPSRQHITNLPPYIMERYRDVTLTGDIVA